MAAPPQHTLSAHLSTPTYVPAPTFSDVTRYLCCAPYVDVTFADKVIDEVIADEQRAVPPSFGFDLDPVVRHCFRARRLLLLQHASVTMLIVAALCVVSANKWLALLAAMAVVPTLLLFRWHVYVVLTRELAHDAPASRPEVHSTRIADRLAAVAGAQRGNITVQERDPFLGSGSVRHGWSFAIALRPKENSSGDENAAANDAAARRAATARIDLDAVELIGYVREAVLRLRDPGLPENARVPGIYVTPHIVADGVRDDRDPLIDPVTRMPHTHASDVAIEAIARCPQGGLRYYERVVVPSVGKAIVTGDGNSLLPGQDLGIEVSAFIHFAVEGGMLYAEFLGAVLPPVKRQYRLVDAIRKEWALRRAFRDTVRTFVADIITSPVLLARAGSQAATLRRRMKEAREANLEYIAYDYGARLSVRELAAEPNLTKFLQRLDGWKYIKLLDKAVADATIGFLDEKGVDTTEFETGVTNVRNEFSNVTNISGGQQNFGGAGATFVQQIKEARTKGASKNG